MNFFSVKFKILKFQIIYSEMSLFLAYFIRKALLKSFTALCKYGDSAQSSSGSFA